MYKSIIITLDDEDMGTVIEFEESNISQPVLILDPGVKPVSTLPEKVDLTFNLGNDLMTLKLKRNDHVLPDIPVIIGSGHRLSRWKT